MRNNRKSGCGDPFTTQTLIIDGMERIYSLVTMCKFSLGYSSTVQRTRQQGRVIERVKISLYNEVGAVLGKGNILHISNENDEKGVKTASLYNGYNKLFLLFVIYGSW